MNASRTLSGAAALALVVLFAAACGGRSPSTADFRALREEAVITLGSAPAAPVAGVVLVDRSCDSTARLLTRGRKATSLFVARIAQTRGLTTAAEVRGRAYPRTWLDERAHRFISDKANPYLQEKDIASRLPRYIDGLASLFRPTQEEDCRLGSDLIGGLLAAQRFLSATPASAYGSGEILLITNGLIYGADGIDLRDGKGLENLRETFARLRAHRRFPHLDSVTVFLLLGTGLDPNITSGVAQGVQRFWDEFLREAGADPRVIVVTDNSIAS